MRWRPARTASLGLTSILHIKSLGASPPVSANSFNSSAVTGPHIFPWWMYNHFSDMEGPHCLLSGLTVNDLISNVWSPALSFIV